MWVKEYCKNTNQDTSQTSPGKQELVISSCVRHILSSICLQFPSNNETWHLIIEISYCVITGKQHSSHSSVRLQTLTRCSSSHLSFAVKTQDLYADTWGSSSLDFMEVSEEVESRSPSPVVQLSLCKYTKQSGLPWVHVTQHCYPQVQELQTHHIMPLTHAWDHQTHQINIMQPHISDAYLLIIWHFPDEDFSYSVWLVRVVIDLPLSENCDVCTHPEHSTQQHSQTQHYTYPTAAITLTEFAKNVSLSCENKFTLEYFRL